jgi:CO/xanthine dehydrogenase Mo-binding subunit
MTASAPLDASMGPVARKVVQDARERIVGTFPFAIDRRVEGSAHVAAVRSSVPHGRIVTIDTEHALAMPGVLAVVTGADVFAALGQSMWHGESRRDQPLLALDVVRYAGEPVALVVAETAELSQVAAAEVDVEYDELDFVVDHDEAARPDAPQLHEEWPGNDCGSWQLVHGDAEAAMKTAAHVDTRTYRSPTANHAPMEPYVATAQWTDRGLDVWSGTQAPYEVRRRLAAIFGLESDRVRVRADNIGGGFGSKLDLKLEGMVAFCARVVGRPVRMELRREEVFVTAAKHAATVTITTGADEDGRLLARIIDVVYNAGAYALSSPRAIRNGMIRSPGPYNIPNVLVRASARYTNTVPTGPFRGAMTGQVCWAHESALDELAQVIGIDPLEIRRRNLLRDGQTFATGETMHEMRYVELIDAAARGIGWGTALPPARDGVVRGRGLAAVLKSTRTPSRSEAHVVLDAVGRVTVRCSSVEMGQGAHWTLAEMAARQLEISPEDILFTAVDTAHTPFDTVTSSSRTTLSMGTAVEQAAQSLRAQIDRHFVDRFGPNLSPRHVDGRVIGADGSSLSYAEVAEECGELVGEGEFRSAEGYGVLDPETSQGLATVSWHQGAVGVEVEVDTRTGRVRVTKAHGASFAGRAIDTERIRKQTEGGMIFGMGQALMEEVVFDAGEVSNPNFSEYQLPSFLDVPADITSTLLTDPDPKGLPHGVGENTVPPMAPAIGNAIFAATGARVRELPLTAERVLRAIRDGETERSGRES